jgi:hypothetical protein
MVRGRCCGFTGGSQVTASGETSWPSSSSSRQPSFSVAPWVTPS